MNSLPILCLVVVVVGATAHILPASTFNIPYGNTFASHVPSVLANDHHFPVAHASLQAQQTNGHTHGAFSYAFSSAHPVAHIHQPVTNDVHSTVYTPQAVSQTARTAPHAVPQIANVSPVTHYTNSQNDYNHNQGTFSYAFSSAHPVAHVDYPVANAANSAFYAAQTVSHSTQTINQPSHAAPAVPYSDIHNGYSDSHGGFSYAFSAPSPVYDHSQNYLSNYAGNY